MSSSNFDSISSALTTGTIIAIVIGSVCGLIVLIGIIVVIVCIVKHLNRPRHMATNGMVLQQPQSYSYPQTWPNQYQPNAFNMTNYPTMYQTVSAPYTVPMPNYAKPMNT
ncbi:hypothetical protein I4U23_024805 [Adineta vaga]|nr:hypothetical protein I4U23_024805 [Adineta vaga]